MSSGTLILRCFLDALATISPHKESLATDPQIGLQFPQLSLQIGKVRSLCGSTEFCISGRKVGDSRSQFTLGCVCNAAISKKILQILTEGSVTEAHLHHFSRQIPVSGGRLWPMGGFISRRDEASGGWRAYFLGELNRLQRELPESRDRWAPHIPNRRVVAIAHQILNAVKRDDLPLPLLVAGSDGSIQIRWRRHRELSIFVRPDDAVEFLEVYPDGGMQEGLLKDPTEVPPLIDWLLAS